MNETWPWLHGMLHASAATTVGSVLLRLVAAAALGGIIGAEREMKHRPAGLRTNMFICFGAALFTTCSLLLAGPAGSEQTRIASQIIPGIGFIGAGSILRARGGVHGLTTAATIFVVAAIGMCSGAGLLVPAAIASVLVLAGLRILGLFEQHVFVRPYPAAYQASAGGTQELYSLLDQACEGRWSKLIDVKFSIANQMPQVEFILEAEPQIHHQLRERLRAEFDSHKIISFSSSEQE